MRGSRRLRGSLRWAVVALLLDLAIACGGSGGTPTQPSSPAQTTSSIGDTYLRALLTLMQTNSVNRLRINWTDFQNQVLAKSPGATTISATFPAIQLALGLLDDHHSFYIMANNAGAIGNPSFPAGCSIAVPDDFVVPADVGYLRIPEFGGTDVAGFAASLQAAIRTRDGGNLAGWIVDLRGNFGGNMWPMIAGVGPILGNGPAGYFVSPDGSSVEWGYRTGASYSGGGTVVSVTNPYELARPTPRVAVITDKRVASSGEAVAVAFRGRPDTRTFGTDTCGLPSANANYTLSDGAVLVLTTAHDADRTRREYDAPLSPDETIADPAALLTRVVAWLRTGR